MAKEVLRSKKHSRRRGSVLRCDPDRRMVALPRKWSTLELVIVDRKKKTKQKQRRTIPKDDLAFCSEKVLPGHRRSHFGRVRAANSFRGRDRESLDLQSLRRALISMRFAQRNRKSCQESG